MEVGLYHPEGWLRTGHWPYENQTANKSGRWGNVSYHVNNKKLTEAKFVVVHEDLDEQLRVTLRGGKYILVIGEEKSVKQYSQPFINQFDAVVTSRDDIQHHTLLKTHYFHPWSVQRTYDELQEDISVKTEILSAIISNATVLPGHKNRFAFINKLKGHYKDNLHWFAKGESTFVSDKWIGLSPYHYSIAIENSQHTHYFTEKLSDCFLAETFPFYWGCPNIADYFDERSFLLIDVNNYINAIDKIDTAIRENIAEKNKAYILESKRLVLEKYNFLAGLTQVLNGFEKSDVSTRRTLYPQSHFGENPRLAMLKKSLKKIIG